MPSEPLAPVSLASETVGAATWVSRVKLTVVAAEVLPATSVWRTATVLLPSTGVKVGDQVWPPSVLYSTVAPVSVPPMVRAPLLVMPSEPLAPVSLVSETVGAAGAVVSTKALEKAALSSAVSNVVEVKPSVGNPIVACTCSPVSSRTMAVWPPPEPLAPPPAPGPAAVASRSVVGSKPSAIACSSSEIGSESPVSASSPACQDADSPRLIISPFGSSSVTALPASVRTCSPLNSRSPSNKARRTPSADIANAWPITLFTTT